MVRLVLSVGYLLFLLCGIITIGTQTASASSTQTPTNSTPRPIAYACVTGMDPTTSYLLNEKDGKLISEIIHHNGVDFIPIHSGSVTPHDLKLLAKKSVIFARMGPRLKLEWDMTECRRDPNGLALSCDSSLHERIGTLDIESRSLHLQTVVTTLPATGLKSTSIQATFSVSIREEPYAIYNYSSIMDYSQDSTVPDCIGTM